MQNTNDEKKQLNINIEKSGQGKIQDQSINNGGGLGNLINESNYTENKIEKGGYKPFVDSLDPVPPSGDDE